MNDNHGTFSKLEFVAKSFFLSLYSLFQNNAYQNSTYSKLGNVLLCKHVELNVQFDHLEMDGCLFNATY